MAPESALANIPFVIALFDDIDPSGSTVLYGDDAEIWDWFSRSESFAPGAEAAELPIPGTDKIAHVSVWAPRTDKAQHLARVPGTGRAHPSLIELHLGRTDTVEFRATYARLVRALPAGRVFEGYW